MRTGAQLLWECLEREGITTVFGYPGGAILPAYDALLASTIHHVLVRHEQGAAHMADGFARASGGIGVAMATSGPGATNLVTGLATAMFDSIPLLAITGQVASGLLGTDAFQELDITGVTIPITKHNYLVQTADDVVPVIREALALATTGRPGPVLVDLTKDAQLGLAVMDWEGSAPHRHRRHLPPGLSPMDLQRMANMMVAAERPLILAGHGVLLAGASEALTRVARQTDIPVASTLLGLGAFPASDPRCLGFMGMHGLPWVNLAIQEADLILSLGMRFDDRVAGHPSSFAPKARKIHVDIDAYEFGKVMDVDLAIHGDAREVLEALEVLLERQRRPAWHLRLQDLRGPGELPPPPGLLTPHAALSELNRQAPEAIVVTDVGQHQMWEAQLWRHERPNTLLTSGGLGTMGFALPAALGAKLARPEAEVWIVVGDGGFQMNVQELATIMQEGVKVDIALLNNGMLGMVRQLQTLYYGDRRTGVAITNPDFQALVMAYGLQARRATTPEEASEAFAWARQQPGPCLVECVLDPEATVYPAVPPGRALDDMILGR